MRIISVLLFTVFFVLFVSCSGNTGNMTDTAVQTVEESLTTSDQSDGLPEIEYDDADFIIWFYQSE